MSYFATGCAPAASCMLCSLSYPVDMIDEQSAAFGSGLRGCQSCGLQAGHMQTNVLHYYILGIVHLLALNIHVQNFFVEADMFAGVPPLISWIWCFTLWLQVQVLDATVFPQPSDLLAMTTPSPLVLRIPFMAGWLTPVSFSVTLHWNSQGDKIQIKTHVDFDKWLKIIHVSYV